MAWAGLLFYYLPVFKLDLTLADQILSALLFVSYLILILAWSYAGPVAAAVLTVLTALAVFYICLALKEAVLFLQVMAYGLLYLCVSLFLYEIQSRLNRRKIQREKIFEDLIASRQELSRQDELQRRSSGGSIVFWTFISSRKH